METITLVEQDPNEGQYDYLIDDSDLPSILPESTSPDRLEQPITSVSDPSVPQDPSTAASSIDEVIERIRQLPGH